MHIGDSIRNNIEDLGKIFCYQLKYLYLKITVNRSSLNVVLYFSTLHATYTGLFISPSGISELNCATTKTEHGRKEHINR